MTSNLWQRWQALLIGLLLTASLFPLAAADEGPGGSASAGPTTSPSETEDRDDDEPNPTETTKTEERGDDSSGPGGDDEDGREARDGDEDDEDDDEDERKVEVETSDEGVRIRLERESESTEDKIEIEVDTENAKFEVKVEQENASAEEELKLEARFLALGEYRDGNGNGQYDSGEALASAWSLGDRSDHPMPKNASAHRLDWGTPVASDIHAGNQTGHKIVVPGTFDGEGALELVLYVFGDYVTFNATQLKPTSVKIDVVIRDYPYVANDTALVLFVQTKMERELESERDHDELDEDEAGIAASSVAGGLDVSLVFAWKEFAEVDGVARPVHSTSIRMVEEAETGEWERKETFALSYARGTNITHDPELFVSIQSVAASVFGGPMGNWVVVGAGAAIAAIGVGVTLGRRLRKP